MKTKATIKKDSYILSIQISDAYRNIFIKFVKGDRTISKTVTFEEAEQIGLINLDALDKL